MNPLRTLLLRVLGPVYRTLVGTLCGPALIKMRRDIWRIDQKINRHLQGEPNNPNPDPEPQFDHSAYPYLEAFPWEGARPEKEELVK